MEYLLLNAGVNNLQTSPLPNTNMPKVGYIEIHSVKHSYYCEQMEVLNIFQSWRKDEQKGKEKGS